MDSGRWFNLSVKAQESHIKKVLTRPWEVFNRIWQSLYMLAMKMNNGCPNHESFINTDVIPTNSLKDIWIKAKKLLFIPCLVVPIPRKLCSQNRMAASEHNEPHHVACKSSGQLVCSGICPQFSTYRVCQHTVAAAKATNNFQKYCHWWKKQSYFPDLDSLGM